MLSRISGWTLCALLVQLGLVTWFYAPVVLGGQIQIHGEGISHGIPLLTMLSNVLHGGETALWTDKMYAGHPIFAEGQGAFAHPLVILVSYLFSPVRAYNLLPWLCSLICSGGVYLLCRSAGCGRGSSLFASLALVFSSIFIGGRSNLSVGTTITWIPWAIWAMLRWQRHGDFRSAGLFGLVMSLMILSGYPHIVHGTVIYMAVYLLVSMCFPTTRRQWLLNIRPLLLTGGFAVLVCVGLAAVQWLPLLELVSQSHRSEGATMLVLGSIPAENFFRGLLYTFNESQSAVYPLGSDIQYQFPVLGSLLVCLTVSAILLSRLDAGIVGHLAATLFLLVLGFGKETPLFQLIYDNRLLPGLHSFRIMFPYLFVAAVGLSILGALSLEGLRAKRPANNLNVRLVTGIFLTAAWAWTIYRFHISDVYTLQYITPVLFLIGCVILFWTGKRRWIPLVATAMLCAEIIGLRMHPVIYGDIELLAKPASINRLQQEKDLQLFKVADNTIATLYSMRHPRDPAVPRGLRGMLASMSPSSTVLWDIANARGNTALPLRRQAMAEERMLAELNGGLSTAPGLRLIDFLSLKFIASKPVHEGAGFKLFYRDAETGAHIVANPQARPKFQWFDKIRVVPGPEQALQSMLGLQEPVLFVEGESDLLELPTAPGTPGLGIRRHESGLYRLSINARGGQWLLIADADYPGWKAFLNDEPVRHYPAQVLGKAIYIPPGEHELELVFDPASFRIGLYVSLFSCIFIAAMFLFAARGRTATSNPQQGPSTPGASTP